MDAARRSGGQGPSGRGATGMSDRWMRYFEFFRRDPRRDFDDEMTAHVELRVADLVARGVPRDAAESQARTEFGDADVVREHTVRIDERVIRKQRRAESM